MMKRITSTTYQTTGQTETFPKGVPERPEAKPGVQSPGVAFTYQLQRYNPIPAVVNRVGQELTFDDDAGYNPWDNPSQLAGYPLDLFVNVHSKDEELYVKQKYDNDLYAQEATKEEGFIGTVGAVAGGLTNPLYLAPYLRIGYQMRFAKGAADAAIGEGITEAVYHGFDLDMERTAGESMFNMAAGALFGGVVRQAVWGGNFTKGEQKEIVHKLSRQLKEAQEFVGPPPPPFDETSLFQRLARDLGVEIQPTKRIVANEGVDILGQRPGGQDFIKMSTDLKLWQTTFDEKRWTKPRVMKDGSTVEPIAEDAFQTVEEMAEFIARHERAHINHRPIEGETKGAYETRINNIAMEEMANNPRMSSDQIVTDLQAMEEVGRIQGWFSRQAAKLTPLSTLASPNPEARKLASLLGEQNVVGTQRAAVETMIKSYDEYLGNGFIAANDAFKRYEARVPRGAGRIKRGEFNTEVARALRNGDTSTIPEVQIAAQKMRREILDKIRNKSKEAGIYPSEENIQRFADSYFPRMYNFDYITANLSTFKRDIADWLQKSEYGEGFARADIEEAATEIAAGIRHQYVGTSALSGHQMFNLKSLQGRKVPVPDNVLEKYLVNEPDFVLRAWSHQMATETEMMRMFGTMESSELLSQVEKSWEKQIAEASEIAPQLAKKMERAKMRDLENIQALWDRLLNRYKLPDNQTSAWIRAGRASRNLTVVTKLGGMTLSAFPDLARPLYQHGFRSYANSVAALATDPVFRTMAKADARRAGVAMDMVLNQRMTAITELEYMPGLKHGGFIGAAEHMLEKTVIGRGGQGLDFGRVSLMSPWNSSTKMLTFVMAQDGLLRKVAQRHKFAKELSIGGINDDMAQRIHEQFLKHGETRQSLKLSNLDKWDDLAAAEAAEHALLKEVDATIITPGIMDRPLWMSSEMGKFIGQLKSFGFAATNKQLIGGLQGSRGMFLQGSLSAIAIGAATWKLKRQLAGYDDQEMTNEELLLRGIEYSGVIGFGSEIANFGTGLANAAGIYKGDGNFRWARQGLVGSVAGPNFGTLNDVVRSARVFTNEEPNAGDVEALRRVMPYNNLFWAREIFDAAEKANKDRLGIVE